MKQKNSFPFFIFFAAPMLIGIVGAIWPLVILGFIIFAFMKNKPSSNYRSKDDGIYRYSKVRKSKNVVNSHTQSELDTVNRFLVTYFRNKSVLEMHDGLDLVLKTSKFSDLSHLNVYRDGTRIGTMNFFRSTYPDQFESVIDGLIVMAKNMPVDRSVVQDAEVVKRKDVVSENQKKDGKVHRALVFMNQINELNEDIPDEEISTGLYETAVLLKQIDNFESKFSDSSEKLDKLYIHYLPILIRILKQYSLLQVAKTDPNYEKTYQDLKKTIHLINDAMKHIISTLTDNDFINLSADISTLEAVLQKDGLTSSMSKGTEEIVLESAKRK